MLNAIEPVTEPYALMAGDKLQIEKVSSPVMNKGIRVFQNSIKEISCSFMRFKTGFTMIELLMVIMLVAILGATALPQFLDFRNEAKVAAVQQSLQSMRVGIKNQMAQGILRCGWPAGLAPSYNSFVRNDITVDDSGAYTASEAALNKLCLKSQVTNEADRRFVSGETLPSSPFYQFGTNSIGDNPASPIPSIGNSGSHQVASCSTGPVPNLPCERCSNCASASLNDPLITWCYDEYTGDVWANTNVASECEY